MRRWLFLSAYFLCLLTRQTQSISLPWIELPRILGIAQGRRGSQADAVENSIARKENRRGSAAKGCGPAGGARVGPAEEQTEVESGDGDTGGNAGRDGSAQNKRPLPELGWRP